MSLTKKEEKINLNLNVVTREAFASLKATNDVLSNMLYMVVDDDIRIDRNRYISAFNLVGDILSASFNNDDPTPSLTVDLKLRRFLPLSGGTMTGGIAFDTSNYANKTNTSISIGGGQANQGGSITLDGTDNKTATITAKNTNTEYTSLKVFPDGKI